MEDGQPSDGGDESIDVYRTLVEESTDVATIIDTDGTMTYVSPAVRRVLGYDPDELVGTTGYEYVHPDDRERNADAVEAVRTNPEEPQTVEVRFRRADGSWCWIEATMRNRLDDEIIDGILLILSDTSDAAERWPVRWGTRRVAGGLPMCVFTDLCPTVSAVGTSRSERTASVNCVNSPASTRPC